MYNHLLFLTDREQSKTSSRVNKNTVKSSHISDDVRDVMKQRLSSEYELYEYVKQKLLKQYNKVSQS